MVPYPGWIDVCSHFPKNRAMQQTWGYMCSSQERCRIRARIQETFKIPSGCVGPGIRFCFVLGKWMSVREKTGLHRPVFFQSPTNPGFRRIKQLGHLLLMHCERFPPTLLPLHLPCNPNHWSGSRWALPDLPQGVSFWVIMFSPLGNSSFLLEGLGVIHRIRSAGWGLQHHPWRPQLLTPHQVENGLPSVRPRLCICPAKEAGGGWGGWVGDERRRGGRKR